MRAWTHKQNKFWVSTEPESRERRQRSDTLQKSKNCRVLDNFNNLMGTELADVPTQLHKYEVTCFILVNKEMLSKVIGQEKTPRVSMQNFWTIANSQ